MKVRDIIPATKLIRGAMRANGRKKIFTNKYKTCRTVKCYIALRLYDHNVEEKLVNDISTVLKEAGYTDFSFNTTSGTRWTGLGGFIVRLPL